VLDYLAKNFSKHPKADPNGRLRRILRRGDARCATRSRFGASRGAHPQGRVADRATRRAERRCAAFSATS